MVKHEEVVFEGHKCLRMSNDVIEVFVTLDMGPRILGYNLLGRPNIFCVSKPETGRFDGPLFDQYYWKGATHNTTGGHRLWLFPESYPETYYPDNQPVEYFVYGSSVFFQPQPQKINNVLAKIEVEFMGGSQLKIHHRVTNVSSVPKTMAICGISMMDCNGVEMVKLNQNDTGLLPNRSIVFWPYADLTDSRFCMGKKYITVKADATDKKPFKFGTDNRIGTAVYCTDSQVFITRFSTNHDHCDYVDSNCSFESYTSGGIIEVETLDHVRVFTPGNEQDFKVIWELRENDGMPDYKQEDQVDAFWDQAVKTLKDHDL